METELRESLRALACIAAFGSALWLGGRVANRPSAFVRLAAGLVLAALSARLGFAWLHGLAPGEMGVPWSDPFRGTSALFVPAGPLLAAPWHRGGAAFREHLAASLVPLPLALGVARLGCAIANCCHGSVVGSLPALEIGGLIAVSAATAHAAPRRQPGLALLGCGGVRIATEFLRDASPLGPARIPRASIAAMWMGIGLVLSFLPQVPPSERS